MPQKNPITIPSPIAPVRTSGYNIGDTVEMYGKKLKVVGTRPDGNPVLDLAKPPQIKRGRWLSKQLTSLYSDNTYKRATPEVQKMYKTQAYDKWVVPYFKHIGMEPPSRERFLGEPEKKEWILTGARAEEATRKGAIQQASILKETSKITAGLLNDLQYLSDIGQSVLTGKSRNRSTLSSLITGKKEETVLEKASKFMRGREEYYKGQLEDLTNEKELTWHKDLNAKLVEGVVDGVFFEATGVSKAAKIFRIANPRTARLAAQLAKSAWNGAVEFGAWQASQGDTPADIGKGAALGATLGPTARLTGIPLRAAFSRLMGTIFKFGGPSVASRVFETAIQKSKGLPEDTTKQLPRMTEDTKKAVDHIVYYLDEFAKENHGKDFKDIPWIKQRALINKILADDVLPSVRNSAGSPDAELLHTFIKENQEKINYVAPEVAPKVEQKVDDFVKKATNGKNPDVVKIHATLPHHNTDETSSVAQIGARISFLRNKLSQGGSNEEKQQIIQAIKEEKALLDKVKTKRAESVNQPTRDTGFRFKPKDKGKSTVGPAAVNDSRVFQGDGFIIRPTSTQDGSIFKLWRDDKEAGDVVKQIAAQSPVGMLDRRVQNIMTSFQAGNSLEEFATKQFQDTRVMMHPKYGSIGGINFAVIGPPNDKTLMLNWIALRPNVVARAYDVPGAGQTLFLQVLDTARANNAGLKFHSAPSAVKFYQKVLEVEGDENHNFDISAQQVRDILKKKGLLMMLIGGGITYGATKEQLSNDTQVRMK